MHNNIIGDALNIALITFCHSIIDAVKKWEKEMNNDSNYIKNYKRLMKIHIKGIPPYIVGVPVIS